MTGSPSGVLFMVFDVVGNTDDYSGVVIPGFLRNGFPFFIASLILLVKCPFMLYV